MRFEDNILLYEKRKFQHLYRLVVTWSFVVIASSRELWEKWDKIPCWDESPWENDCWDGCDRCCDIACNPFDTLFCLLSHFPQKTKTKSTKKIHKYSSSYRNLKLHTQKRSTWIWTETHDSTINKNEFELIHIIRF